jgi:predicted flap endonuclease-1-like 5' DNA nuclease
MDFTANQWAILALTLVLGWLLGLLSRSGGARWRRSYEEERAARIEAERRLADANSRIATLERDVAARPIGAGTAGAIGAAAAGRRDDLTLVRGISRGEELRLNEAGIHSYRDLAALTDAQAAELEARLGLSTGIVRREEWREQAAMLRDNRLDEHRSRYAIA